MGLGLLLAVVLLATASPVRGQLSVTKLGPGVATPGETLGYTILVQFQSPGVATVTPRVVDAFPAALSACTWACSAGANTACGASGGSGDLDDTPTMFSVFSVVSTVTYTATCRIDPGAVGTVVNTVEVSEPGRGVVATASFGTVLVPEADLAITKTGPATATPGGTITYTVDVTNPSGPSAAGGVAVGDPAPAELSGITWTCAARSGASCATASGTGSLAATVDLPVGGGATFGVTGTVDPAATGTITNTATVGGPAGGSDPDTSDNSASHTSSLVPSADLAITKSDGAATAVPGESIVYTVVASNEGPSVSSGALVSDAFPATLENPTWTCVEAGGATCTSAGAGALADTVDLPAGSSATYTVQATVSADATGSLVNTATIAEGATNDPDPANNLATDTDTLTRTAGLSLTKTDLADPVLAGGTLLYRLVVANAGPSRASGAEVTDLLPAGLSFVSATGAAACFAALDVLTGRDRVTCSFGELAAAGRASVTLTTAVGTAASGELLNEATVAGVGGDLDPSAADDAASETTTVVAQGDLALTKTGDHDPVAVGDTLVYTLTITNAGLGTVDGVTLTDPLPVGVSFLSATPSQGACTGGGVVDCALGSLAAGASATVALAVLVEPSAADSVTNQASVSAPIADTDPANDTASVVTTVSRTADLSLAKTASPSPVGAGSLLRYTFTVTNHGPADAPSTVITDELPEGTSFVAPVVPGELIFADGFESGDTSAWIGASGAAAAAITEAGAACSASGSTVACALGTVAAGATATAAFDVEVLSTASGSLTNSATVSSAVHDPEPADDSAAVTVSVVRRIDVGVEIADAPDPVAPGGVLVYTLTVTNAGPGAATGVAVGDPLPPELFLLSVVPSQGSCTQAQEVLCELGSLGPGASATVVVETTVDGGAFGAITNAAAVIANETDLDAANDTDTEVTTVSQ